MHQAAFQFNSTLFQSGRAACPRSLQWSHFNICLALRGYFAHSTCTRQHFNPTQPCFSQEGRLAPALCNGRFQHLSRAPRVFYPLNMQQAAFQFNSTLFQSGRAACPRSLQWSHFNICLSLRACFTHSTCNLENFNSTQPCFSQEGRLAPALCNGRFQHLSRAPRLFCPLDMQQAEFQSNSTLFQSRRAACPRSFFTEHLDVRLQSKNQSAKVFVGGPVAWNQRQLAQNTGTLDLTDRLVAKLSQAQHE
jgi:hypothetical protein